MAAICQNGTCERTRRKEEGVCRRGKSKRPGIVEDHVQAHLTQHPLPDSSHFDGTDCKRHRQ